MNLPLPSEPEDTVGDGDLVELLAVA